MHHTARITITPWGTRAIAAASVIAILVLLVLFTSNSATTGGALDVPTIQTLDDEWAWSGSLWA